LVFCKRRQQVEKRFELRQGQATEAGASAGLTVHGLERVVRDAAALEQLVALGYIEEPDADQSKAIAQTVRELDYNLA
jgi:hypothetical protein